jgi:EAL domain-containing protein (putative c-di-GMP-specific phosphodiesterase class I)
MGAGANPSMLTLEITETAPMKDIAAAQRFAAGVAHRLAREPLGPGDETVAEA